MRAPKLLVVDKTETLARQVEQATSTLRPRPTVARWHRLSSLDETLEQAGPVDVLLAGPTSVTESGLKRLRQLRAQRPGMSVMLAFDRRPDATLREIVRAGAVDVLHLPVGDDVIVSAVEEALELGRHATRTDTEPRSADHHGQGTVVAVVSATGGCGKTFLATNLAYHLQERVRMRTCLVDLDLQFGELATALRLRPRYTITDLLARDDAEEDLADRIEEYLVAHDTGIHLLAAPAEPAEADAVTHGDVERVIAALRSRFDYVILDTPAVLSEAAMVAVETADRIFAAATLDLPSVRNLGVLLTTLNGLKIPSDRVELVLNKVERDVGIDIDHVLKYFPQGFSMVVPYGREVNRSLNMGMPMLAYQPGSDVGRVLSTGLEAWFPPPAGDAADSGRWRPFRRKRAS